MTPRFLISPSLFDRIHDYYNCIIIGSGIAGLSTAIRISKSNTVKVMTKSTLKESTTWYAQGGIAAVIKKPDNWKNHFEDTIIAGQGLCDEKAVKMLVKHAPEMIEDLLEKGILFDIVGGEISLTLEGGHSFPRVLHAGGDATGEEIEKKLVSYSKKLNSIKLLPGCFAVDIIVKDNRCCGVTAINALTGKLEIHPCSNVVIASGGLGQLYEFTTNPAITTGDGIAMAHRAGASITDMEFIQFHPTVFKTVDGSLFLITEALRGEGAFLRDCNGNRFMVGKHPKAELAPRDIIVRQMVKVMEDTNTNFLYLDATHLPSSLLKLRFPNILLKLKENGLDLKRDLIKISPAEHYLNGGIKTDYSGQTDIRGIFSCGESASTGVHGANRLASNSLIEGLVFGWKIAEEVTAERENDIKDSKKVLACIENIIDAEKPVKDIADDIIPDDIDEMKNKLRAVMTKYVGISRDRKGLEKAGYFIEKNINNAVFYNKKNIQLIEYINMLSTASLTIKSALLREESRGTHLRVDFSKKDDKNWKKHIIIKKENITFKSV